MCSMVSGHDALELITLMTLAAARPELDDTVYALPSDETDTKSLFAIWARTLRLITYANPLDGMLLLEVVHATKLCRMT